MISFSKFLPYCLEKTFLCVRHFNTAKCSHNLYKMIIEDVKNQKSDPTLLMPPPCVRGMKELNKAMFDKIVIIPWVLLHENQVSVAVKYLKKYLLKLIHFKPLQASSVILDGEEIIGSNFVENASQGSGRRAFLNPLLVAVFTDISDQDQLGLKNIDVSERALHYSKITLKYSNWKLDEVLKAILPQDDPLTSYSIIGHITHVNLHEPLLSYKSVIGQVLLDKVVGCKTVVNKTDVIDNTYRNFKMELLCGENNLKTQTKENGCTYELDFSSVYWNPRLSTEHERIVQKLKSGDILYDVFAGIGPFAVPAARKKCYVLANDLNPDSYKWLQKNGKLNKVSAFLKTFNKDGKLFLQEDVKKDLVGKWKQKEFKGKAFHIAMNLPALAVTFLPVFKGMFAEEDMLKVNNFPTVHVYCFAKKEDSKAEATKMVEENLGTELGNHLIEVFVVRNVAPNKEMMRISFKLWRELLQGSLITSSEILSQDNPGQRKLSNASLEVEEPLQKRICLENNAGSHGKEQREQQEQT